MIATFSLERLTSLLFPKHPITQLPEEVPERFAADFREAHDTLPISPKASAALSRRCLQTLIREKEDILERPYLPRSRSFSKPTHFQRR